MREGAGNLRDLVRGGSQKSKQLAGAARNYVLGACFGLLAGRKLKSCLSWTLDGRLNSWRTSGANASPRFLAWRAVAAGVRSIVRLSPNGSIRRRAHFDGARPCLLWSGDAPLNIADDIRDSMTFVFTPSEQSDFALAQCFDVTWRCLQTACTRRDPWAIPLTRDRVRMLHCYWVLFHAKSAISLYKS